MITMAIIAASRADCARYAEAFGQEEYGIRVTDLYPDREAALEDCLKKTADLYLVGPAEDARTTLGFCRRLLKRDAMAKILLIDAEEEPASLLEALNAGIFGWLRSDNIAKQLPPILERFADRAYFEQHSRHIFRRQLLRDILKGKIAAPEEIHALFGTEPKEYSRWLFLLIHKDIPFRIAGESHPIDYYAIHWHTMPLPEDFCYVATVNLEMETWGMLLRVNKSMSSYKFYTSSYEIACTAQYTYRQQTGNTVSVALSEELSDPSELVACRNQLQKKLEMNACYGPQYIYTRENASESRIITYEYYDNMIRNLSGLYEMENYEMASDLLTRLFDRLSAESASAANLRHITNLLLAVLENLKKRKHLPRTDWSAPEPADCYTIRDVCAWFRDRFEEYRAEVSGLYGGIYSEKVANAMRMVSLQCGRINTVQDVAGYLNVSSDYLRHLFKKETGQCLQKYIIGVKIDRAGRLLQDTDMKISEVAAAVGFNTVQYFSTVFKRQTGQTPTDYILSRKRNPISEG